MEGYYLSWIHCKDWILSTDRDAHIMDSFPNKSESSRSNLQGSALRVVGVVRTADEIQKFVDGNAKSSTYFTEE